MIVINMIDDDVIDDDKLGDDDRATFVSTMLSASVLGQARKHASLNSASARALILDLTASRKKCENKYSLFKPPIL